MYFRFQKSKTQFPPYQSSNLTTHRFSTTDIRSYKPAQSMRTEFLYMEAKIQRVMSAKLQNLHKWNSNPRTPQQLEPCCGRPQVSSLARDSAVCCGYMFRSSNLWFRFGDGAGVRAVMARTSARSHQTRTTCPVMHISSAAQRSESSVISSYLIVCGKIVTVFSGTGDSVGKTEENGQPSNLLILICRKYKGVCTVCMYGCETW